MNRPIIFHFYLTRILKIFLFFLHFTASNCLFGGNPNSFQNLKGRIECGAYREVWEIISQSKSKLTRAEKYWLQGKVLHDQGAHYLALERLDSLEALIASERKSQKDWGEDLYTLRADIFYQLLEFNLFFKQVLELEKWRTRFFNADSLRMALSCTYKAKYYAAMVKPDSARLYTQRALRLWWKFGAKGSNIPAWHIYANHVTCLRNSAGFPFDKNPEAQDLYSDTCLTYLNERFPNVCMDKLRGIQTLVIAKFDRLAGYKTWENPNAILLQNYAYVTSSMLSILAEYRKMVGPRHTYISQIHYFLGLVEVYRNNTEKAIRYLKSSMDANFSCMEKQPFFCLSWQRMLSINRFLPGLQFENKGKREGLSGLLGYCRKLEESEEVFFLRYFFIEDLQNQAEDDVYGFHPFSELSSVYHDLFEQTKSAYFLNASWDCAQKGRYIDILRKNLFSDTRHISARQHAWLMPCISRMRMANDSLLLSLNRFSMFSLLNREKISKYLKMEYTKLRQQLKFIGSSDPFTTKFIRGHPAYQIRQLQKQLGSNNRAWISVNHYSTREKDFKTILWVICPDTFWVHKYAWNADGGFLPEIIRKKLQQYNHDGLLELLNQQYQKTFSFCYQELKNRKINKIYYCDDPLYPLGNPEILVKDLNGITPKYLLNDFTFSFRLLLNPKGIEFSGHNLSRNKNFVVCPRLSKKYADLSLARLYADSISNLLNADLVTGNFKKSSFTKCIQQAHIVQLFSHGEGLRGLVFSDGNLLPEEIRRLSIKAECISLTTCESFNGEIIRGEGVKGMAEALMSAGAKRVIASFMKIDERSSSKIMLSFYENIKSGLPADEALQKAKIQFVREAHEDEKYPSFWGGLILIGETAPIEIYPGIDNRLLFWVTFFTCTFSVFFILAAGNFSNRIFICRYFHRLWQRLFP